MTSKASSTKFHPAWNLFKFSIKRNIGLTVLVSIFTILLCPGYTVIFIQNNIRHNDLMIYNFNDLMTSMIILISIATTAIGMLFLFINFSFLYSKNSSDLYHSLPTSRNGLILSRFFSAVVPLIIPITIAYASMVGITFMKNVNGNLRTIILGYILNLLIVFSCSAFTLIFIVCAGSVYDLVITFFTVNLGSMACLLIYLELCGHYLFGYSNRSSMKQLIWSSPYYFIFYKLSWFLSGESKFANGIIVYIIKLLILSGIFIGISVLLYNHRKSERSGFSFAYKFMYIIGGVFVSFSGAFALGIMFSNGDYNIEYWIFSAVGAILASITYGAIVERGFKTVKKSLIIGASAIAAMAIISVIMVTGGLGFSSRIPAKNNISKAYIEFNGQSYSFENPESILIIHKGIVEDDDKSDKGFDIDITYHLKNKHQMNREYSINPDNYVDKLLKIIKSDEGIESIKAQLNNFTGNDIRMSVYGSKSTEEDNYLGEAPITKKEYKAIFDIYLKELKNATTSIITQDNITEYSFYGKGKNEQHNYYSIYLDDTFLETKQYIDSLKLEERTENEKEIG